jgi:hypothetical protein
MVEQKKQLVSEILLHDLPKIKSNLEENHESRLH